ncbi:protein of unknown function DUF6 transmembrane [Denitrovibrio acetiphilus DSM 12809]|uniref:EamA domain-containing protein n=1 Tax=Denitrovibrio acetiphilus (strain DSM 12809 / NBRC 114555 / N2460) TaxID=522772 RepID=D4H8Q0_DENA2|nr:DMT family transporter [Denitrovibrio acetiphilus]ADD68399.1 protein of unknown function DUF6 transmembrane [Denitrovibrio acetiphilus DSM 12809]
MKNGKLLEYTADASIILISLIWGSTFIIIKKGVDTFEPITYLFLRFMVASVFLFIITLPLMKKINRKLLKDGIILGSVLFIVFLFQTLALKLATATEVGFLTGLYVLFVPVFSALILKKYPHMFSVLGVLLSAAGMMMVTLESSIGLSTGQIFGIINALFLGLYIILIDVYSRRHHVVLLTTVQILTATVLAGVYSWLFEEQNYSAALDPYMLYTILFTGLIATVFCFFVQTAMQKHTTPTKAAIMFTLEPISSAFFSFFIGGEILNSRQYFGAALIVIAILVAEAGTAMRYSVKKLHR